MNYDLLLKKALPYYEAGRDGDVEHIKWLHQTVPAYIPDELDEDIVMAVLLLHDVGYSKVDQKNNPFDLDVRKAHCKYGAEIAEEILTELEVEEEKIHEITRLVRKHDNWAFGDDFSDEPVLAFFNNFDFMWVASKPGFDIVRRFKGQSREEFYQQIKEFRKQDLADGRDWYNDEIAELYNQLMQQRKEEISDK